MLIWPGTRAVLHRFASGAGVLHVPGPARGEMPARARAGNRRSAALAGNANKNADQIVTAAKTQADQLLAETKADAERHRAAAQREVDELTRQKDSIATHLAQVRQLLGGQIPGMDAAPPKPAIAAGAAPSGAPSNGTSGQPAPTTVTPLLPAPR